MNNIWFTSDTHFGHDNVIKYCDRPYSSSEEMDEKMIENWNSVVKKGDIVYHLGDFGFLNSSRAIDILLALNGSKFLVKGNHDHSDFLKETKSFFTKVDKMHTVRVKDPDAMHGRQDIVLCHFPLLVWDKAHYGAWHLHGHSHGGLNHLPKTTRIDVGVDCFDYKPVSYLQIKELMKGRKYTSIDHH